MDGENLARKIYISDRKAQYDQNAKMILAEKIILAHILVHSVAEFKGMDPREVELLIEGEPQVSGVRVNPGESNNPEITGSNTEDSVPYEGAIYYDIRFYVWTPDRTEKIKLIVDVEAQKAFRPGYDIVTRGVFYTARMISAQLGTEFTGSNYDDIKKVYSIWICMDTPREVENTLTRFHMVQEDIVGKEPQDKARFDRLSVIRVCLSRNLAEERDELKLHRLLGTVFSGKMTVPEKKKILESEYGIPMSDDMERRSNYMCNLSDLIWEQGIEQGIDKGRYETLLALYKKGVIREEDIAEQLNISLEEVYKRFAIQKPVSAAPSRKI